MRSFAYRTLGLWQYHSEQLGWCTWIEDTKQNRSNLGPQHFRQHFHYIFFTMQALQSGFSATVANAQLVAQSQETHSLAMQ